MKIELKWAALLGLLTLLWFVLEKVMGFDGDFIEYHQTAGWFYLIPFVLIYVLALMQKKNLDLGGKMTFLQGLKSVIIIAVLSVPMIILAAYLKIALISPDFQSNMMSFLISTGADEGLVKNAFSTTGFLMTTGMYALSGILFGAIAALFIKND